jgi:hypothetical protein
MAFLRGVSDRFWNYVSPRKTQQRRENKSYAFKVPPLPTRATPSHKDIATPFSEEMSPQTRVKTWDPRTPSPQSDMDIDVTLLPPSPPTSAMQSDDFEGDTLANNSPGALNKTGEEPGSSADEWDANEETMVVDDGTYMTLQKKINIEKERNRRDQQGHELREAGWSEDVVFLFQKLGMRGFEPILPIGWIDDFETVPEDLFTENMDKAFIKPAFGSDYSGMYAWFYAAAYSLTINSAIRSRQALRPRGHRPRRLEDTRPPNTRIPNRQSSQEIHEMGHEGRSRRPSLGPAPAL